jgi:hypothetical protein
MIFKFLFEFKFVSNKFNVFVLKILPAGSCKSGGSVLAVAAASLEWRQVPVRAAAASWQWQQHL